MQISKKSFILWLTSFCLTIAFTTYHSHSSPVSDPKIGAPSTWSHEMLNVCLEDAHKNLSKTLDCYSSYVVYCVEVIGISERKKCYSESLPWWTKKIEILKQKDPKLLINLFSQQWQIVCPSIEYDPQCHVDKMIRVIFNYEQDKIEG